MTNLAVIFLGVAVIVSNLGVLKLSDRVSVLEQMHK